VKKKTVLFLMIAVIVSDLLLVFVWHPWQMKKELNLIDIPVATRRLEHRHKIEMSDISWKKMPYEFVSDDAVLNPSEIVGKRVSNEVVILEGAMFDEKSLNESKDILDRSSLNLKKNQAAFSIPADVYQAAGNTLVINQKVDLYVCLHQRSEIPIIDCLIKNVRILDLRDRKGLTLDDKEGTGIVSTIIVAIDQEMIPLLTSASLLGTIQLYATENSWNTTKECILNQTSQIIPLLVHEESKSILK